MERAAKGHKDITGSISRKRETELKDDTLPDGTTGCDGTALARGSIT